MFANFLKRLGYRNGDDLVEFMMCGLAILPALLMLNGFVLEGGAVMVVLILLLAGISNHQPPPEAGKKHSETPPRHR